MEGDAYEFLQGLELRIRLRQQRLLVLFLPQGGQSPLLVACLERFGCYLALPGEDDFYLRPADSSAFGIPSMGGAESRQSERRQLLQARSVPTHPSLVLLQLVPL